jgi:hypothetical protein
MTHDGRKMDRNDRKWVGRKIVQNVAVEKYLKKVMNGSVTPVGLFFQEIVEEEL